MVYRAALPKGLNAVVVKIELPDTVDPFRYGGEAFWAQIFQIDGPTQPNKRTTIFAVPFDVQLVARPMRLSLRLLRVEKFSKLQFFVRQGASFTPFWKSSPVLGDNLLGIGVNSVSYTHLTLPTIYSV